MKIGILVTGHIDDEHTETHVGYAHMFQQLFKKVGADFEYEIFNVIDDQWPQYVDSCDGWLITGSASGVYENTPWMQKLKKWIVHSHEQGMPMVGICFGHQIIAEAFAGRVEKYTGGWSLGPQIYDLNGLTVEGMSHLKLNAVHQDQVVEKPENARCVGSSDFCQYAMLTYGDDILTIQAHPEFTLKYENALLDYHKGNAIALEPAAKALESLSSFDHKMDDEIVARWMMQIFKNKQSNV